MMSNYLFIKTKNGIGEHKHDLLNLDLYLFSSMNRNLVHIKYIYYPNGVMIILNMSTEFEESSTNFTSEYSRGIKINFLETKKNIYDNPNNLLLFCWKRQSTRINYKY